ncbi:MAG: flagellar protein FhlB [Rhodospirillaceae bacterium]|nr:flagellar protein FhlB [Rhodospirillaceae bacterium]
MKKRQAAFAIKGYGQEKAVPKILAKGYGEVAEKILRLAFDNDVKVRTDPDLAEILSVIDVDCEIPLEAFTAVAEILSYVYFENEKMAESGHYKEYRTSHD